MSILISEIDKLYGVAEDWEADVIDQLRLKAGLTWNCEKGQYDTICWTNSEDDDECGRCGKPRSDIDEVGG